MAEDRFKAPYHAPEHYPKPLAQITDETGVPTMTRMNPWDNPAFDFEDEVMGVNDLETLQARQVNVLKRFRGPDGVEPIDGLTSSTLLSREELIRLNLVLTERRVEEDEEVLEVVPISMGPLRKILARHPIQIDMPLRVYEYMQQALWNVGSNIKPSFQDVDKVTRRIGAIDIVLDYTLDPGFIRVTEQHHNPPFRTSYLFCVG